MKKLLYLLLIFVMIPLVTSTEYPFDDQDYDYRYNIWNVSNLTAGKLNVTGQINSQRSLIINQVDNIVKSPLSVYGGRPAGTFGAADSAADIVIQAGAGGNAIGYGYSGDGGNILLTPGEGGTYDTDGEDGKVLIKGDTNITGGVNASGDITALGSGKFGESLDVNTNEDNQVGLELHGVRLGGPVSERGGFIKMHLDDGYPSLYQYLNYNMQWVFDTSAQATYTDAGVAWIGAFGDASFADTNLTIGADGLVSVDVDNVGIKLGEAQDVHLYYDAKNTVLDNLVGSGMLDINMDTNITGDLNVTQNITATTIKVKNNAIDIAAIYGSITPELKIESLDSYLSLSSEDDATFGSAIILTDFASDGSLNNKWGIIRQTETTGDNRISYTYGTDRNIWDNTELFRMGTNGRFYTNRLESLTGSIDVTSSIDMNENAFYLSEVDNAYLQYTYLTGEITLNSGLDVNGPINSNGLTTTAYDITTTTGKIKANSLIIDGGFPAIPSVIGLDNDGAVSGSLYIGGFDEGGGDVFYNLENGYIYFKNLLLGDGTTSNTTVTINGKLKVTGNATYNSYYGGMFYHNHTGTELSFASDGVYYPLYFTNATHLNGFTANNITMMGNSNLTAQISGLYQVTYMASGDGQNNHEYYTSVYVNLENKDNCENHHKMAAGGDIITQSGTCFIQINKDDQISLRTADIGSTGTGNYYSSNLNLIRLGDI